MSKLQPPRPTSDIAASIAAARGGDEQALEQLIRHYQDRVARYVISVVGRNGDLDDLCQVVFLKMSLSLNKLRSVDVFEPWLFTIARNACRDHLRRARLHNRLVPLSRDHEMIPVPEQKEARERTEILEGALKALPEAQRELIAMLREREYSYEELAYLTKSSVRAVAGRLFRARARLRKFFFRAELTNDD